MGAKDVSPTDFLPDWSQATKRPEQSDEQMMAMMRRLADRAKKRKRKKE